MMITALFLWIVVVVAMGVLAEVNDQQTGSSSPSPHCKAVPGSPDWPGPEKWAKLNETVSGRLIQTTPPGAVCHQNQPTYNTSRCLATQLAWMTTDFHAGDPVSVDWNNWANDTCLPDPRLTCSAAGYPVYVINATTAEHVQAGVNFARENNVRLVVKNSGHDFLGRSSGSNSLSIWVHHMKGIRAHEEKIFRPKNCNVEIPGTVITAGAGTQMLEAYQATAAFNHTLVGGNARTVALGGYMTGGGHSILSPHYGLAVDHVLQMEMVDPSGNILTLNECENEPLFYAMRGGGGSTFGVLTSITIRTLPSPRITGMRFAIQTNASNPHAFDMIAYFLGQIPRLSEAGISGYPQIRKGDPNNISLDPSSSLTGIGGNMIMLNTDDPAAIAAPFDPIFAHVNASWPGEFTMGYETKHYTSFYDWYSQNYDPFPGGISMVISSRLLDGGALTGNGNATAVKVAFEKFAESGYAAVYMVSGKGVWESKFRGQRTAVNPWWREGTYVHAIAAYANYPPQNSRAQADALAVSKTWSAALRELSLAGGGAYVNEAHPDEENWQWEFWGTFYRNLLQIKRRIDPDNVFWCTPCVGSEQLEVVDGRLCQKET